MELKWEQKNYCKPSANAERVHSFADSVNVSRASRPCGWRGSRTTTVLLISKHQARARRHRRPGYGKFTRMGSNEPRESVDNRHCLLYTSDAADDLLCVDLGGRRIIKKKTLNSTYKMRTK